MNEISHAACYRLDQPNPSSWIGNTYSKSLGSSKKRAMQTGTFNFDSVLEALDREIKRNGIAPTNLSLAISKSNKSLLNNIFDGSDIRLSTLTKIADQLEVNITSLIPWATQQELVAIPSEAEIARMIDRAVKQVPGGLSFADYPQAVSSSLHEQLKQYQAGGGYKSEGEASAPDTDAPPPKPTKPSARAKSRNP